MPRATAASGMVRPAKNRNLTSSARTGSSAARRVSAASTPRRLSSGAGACGGGGGGGGGPVGAAAPPPAAVPDPALAAGGLDEDAAHGLGRGGEEVAAARERLVADEAQVRLVDQRRRLERLPRLLGR